MACVGAVIWPPAPLVLPGLSGAHDAGASLRAACLQAWRLVAARQPDTVVLVGAAEATASWRHAAPPGTPFGRRVPSDLRPYPPPALVVGSALADAVGWTGPRIQVGVADHHPASDLELLGRLLAGGGERVALVVMADGSARCGDRAPGGGSPDASRFTADVIEAVRRGDVSGLSLADGREQASWGVPALRVLGGALGTSAVDTEVLLAEEAHGVGYVVAAWQARDGQGVVDAKSMTPD